MQWSFTLACEAVPHMLSIYLVTIFYIYLEIHKLNKTVKSLQESLPLNTKFPNINYSHDFHPHLVD
jgi:hypothetical protein